MRAINKQATKHNPHRKRQYFHFLGLFEVLSISSYIWVMKIALQYLSDSKGETTAVQLSLSEWKKVVAKIKKLEQTLKIKSDLKEAFAQVDALRKTKREKETLNDFLNEL